ncbi:hypothetical protein [Actinopolymorpha rutila]|uniref:Uncharacterized protein n=1 Tax=Actinopolymorpha rutila TaxID=446787 RepID=A0A852ZL31_9ACTN|nr:hypothetical protein [Actinopolymorpha rutila]NYH92923.1 hypothetical protein [Actinopolymorpha rutila]
MNLLGSPSLPLDEREKIVGATCLVAGMLGGALWQVLHPRDLVVRLRVVPLLMIAAVILLLLTDGQVNPDPYPTFAWPGILGGLVAAGWWQRKHASTSEQSKPRDQPAQPVQR